MIWNGYTSIVNLVFARSDSVYTASTVLPDRWSQNMPD